MFKVEGKPDACGVRITAWTPVRPDAGAGGAGRAPKDVARIQTLLEAAKISFEPTGTGSAWLVTLRGGERPITIMMGFSDDLLFMMAPRGSSDDYDLAKPEALKAVLALNETVSLARAGMNPKSLTVSVAVVVPQRVVDTNLLQASFESLKSLSDRVFQAIAPFQRKK